MTRAEMVLRAAMKRILRLDLSLRNQFPEAVRDGEDDMSVFGIEAERGGLDRKLFGIFDAAGITETRMAVSVDGSKVITNEGFGIENNRSRDKRYCKGENAETLSRTQGGERPEASQLSMMS